MHGPHHGGWRLGCSLGRAAHDQRAHRTQRSHGLPRGPPKARRRSGEEVMANPSVAPEYKVPDATGDELPSQPLKEPPLREGSHQFLFRVWRGGPGAAGQPPKGEFKDYRTTVTTGMVVLDVIHQIQAEQQPDLACRWNCKAGKCGSCSAEVNGQPRLMCMTRMDEFEPGSTVIVEPLQAFPPVKDLVTDVSWNFRAKQRIKPFKPRKPDAPDGTWRMDQADVDRVQEFRKCIECFL